MAGFLLRRLIPAFGRTMALLALTLLIVVVIAVPVGCNGFRNVFVTFVPELVSGFGLIFGASLVVDYIFKLGGVGTLFLTLLPFTAQGIVQVDTYALVLLLLVGAAFMFTLSADAFRPHVQRR